jgi:hypothetical protein
MKWRVAFWGLLCALAGTLMVAPAMAYGPHFGEYDTHHVWHDAEWWHHNYPDWMYSHHPQWAVHYDWWAADHRYHPGWFRSPFWRDHPMWAWGARGPRGVWHDYRWWHEHDPGWMYAHHPEWAGPYGRWIREDHGRHPEWFRTAYWHEHPRDWSHPDREYWRRQDEHFKTYQREHPEARYHENRFEHAGPRMNGPHNFEHPEARYHARGPEPAFAHKQSLYHPAGASPQFRQPFHPEAPHVAAPHVNPVEHTTSFSHGGGGESRKR